MPPFRFHRRASAGFIHRAVACFCAISLVGGAGAPATAASRAPLRAEHGMVASGHPLASEVGLAVLQNGGNAVDAAVATALALNVVTPYAGVLGGGGFMLIYRAEQRDVVVIDFREKAPLLAHRAMYLDDAGQIVPGRSTEGHLAVAVPGGVAGLALALQDYGTQPLSEMLKPAIRFASRGVPVSVWLHTTIARHRDRLIADAEASAAFLTAEGEPLPAGALLQQPQLAWTLRRLARAGWQDFYTGLIAGRIVTDMTARGGLITKEDLAIYRPTVRKPVHGTYRGYDIWSMPPPSSGGIHLVQMLNVLEGYDLAAWGYGAADYVHHLTETMKLAFADRSKFLGDPAFVGVPMRGLTAPAYANELRMAIAPDRARPSEDIAPGTPLRYESGSTVHLSVVDNRGNAVALTQTLNSMFGAGVMAAGTGIFLNNEMDDFSAKPGVSNQYGLMGGTANAIAPGKRPLSSMSPTIVTRAGRPFLVLGSPGGSRIITAVLQTIIHVIDFNMNVQEAVDAPRVHHQWLPPVLMAGRFALAPEVQSELEGRGHNIKAASRAAFMGDVHAIRVDPHTGALTAGTDPRREGGAAGY